MNDSIFANYDNYNSTTSLQMTDVISLTQNTEYEELPQTVYFLNNLSCDAAPSIQTGPVDQRHQQTNLFNFMPNTIEEPSPKLDGQSSIVRVNNGGILGNVGSSGNVFGNIPFVQIHTTDVQPQRTSYGNVFRRNISRQDEIKSEPIKSENAEATKDRINATPTPPRTNQSQNENNTEANEKQNATIDNKNVEEKSNTVLQIFKCSQCPFISLKNTELDEHVASEHVENAAAKDEERHAINCPGCNNVFFNQESLEIHLKLDHLMIDEDVLKVINVFMDSSGKISKSTCDPSEHVVLTTDSIAVNTSSRKSRIYLKNVDCLREPNRQPMEKTVNQLMENSSNHFSQPTKKTSTKQKISIKSVDVLREPALLRRDYEMQSPNLNNFVNFNTDLLSNSVDLISNPVSLSTTNTYDFPPNLDRPANKQILNNNDSNFVNSETGEKSRRPKIYVKSVESFNLMPIDPLRTTNTSRFLNDHSSSCSSAQAFDSNPTHLPYMFDSSSVGNTLNNNTSFINSHNEMDTFQYINNSNPNNSYILDNSLFVGNTEELNENCEQMENMSLIVDTTPTPPATGDMNSNTIKPLASTQEQRGTLHLRTVDELNLMNKTEVQHLIAPNLDNNHNAEIIDKVNSSSLNDISLIGDALYEDENFKFHDLDTQMVNDWPATYEDLAEDINCIIADASNENSTEYLVGSVENNNKKINNFDIDTPQVSLITIRDIEELTGTANHDTIHSLINNEENFAVELMQESQNVASEENDTANQESQTGQQANQENENENNLKRELVNATPESNTTSTVANVTTITINKETTKKPVHSTSEIPPLVPVTNTTSNLFETNSPTTNVSPLPNSSIPLPPLVPVSTIKKKVHNVPNTPTNKAITPAEKGRIYVANNLMEVPKRPIAVSATNGTSVRGRPFGSNRTRITKLKQTIGTSAEDLFAKCSVKGCAFRFKKSETVEYHRKCHDTRSSQPQAMWCPECKSTEFNNWNTLHTHLWRAHQIDMELYKCELCEFKTPIFSRLVNTHAKIHFDDRNYKCEQCEKAFKNSKQLKNHRRWHRVQATTPDISNRPKVAPAEIHRCSNCGSTFSQQKTLRDHCCKSGQSLLKCSVCEKLMSSKSSLRLHLLTHSDGEKRYKCQNCDYTTNDHNAFRRHRMGHENRKMYDCTFCSYRSVQSVAYQKHILQKHPEKADSVIHKCTVCSYSTINRSLLVVHKAKHETVSDDLLKAKNSEEMHSSATADRSMANNATETQKSKIKVKSNLFTTYVNERVVNITNTDLNSVQLYNIDSSGVT